MKKIICLPLFFLLVTTTKAQTKFGIFAGPQLSTASYTIAGEKQSTSSKTGFQLGAGWKIPFDEKLFFSPAVFYSLKGYKVALKSPSFPPDIKAIDNNTQLHTVELAFLLQYDFSKQPGHFFVKAGPSLDFQLAGNEKYNRNDGTSVDQKMKFSFGDYGHYAASLLMQLGYETKQGVSVFAQYTQGLGSINNADNGPGIKHRVIGLSIGKYFGKRKA